MTFSGGVMLGVAFALGATVVAPPPAASDGVQAIDAPIVIEAQDLSIDVDDPALMAQMRSIHAAFEQGSTLTVPGPAVSGLHRAVVGSGMSVTFDATYPSPGAAQAVILAAAQDWDEALLTTAAGPVEIAVIWKNLGSPSLLGSAGPNGLYAGGALPAGAYYPAGLANTLLGYDLDTSQAELTINLNSQANWYIGTSGTPGAGQIDLSSVVLHELGHGLGFIGSGSLHNHAPSTEPTLEDTPFVFDREVTHNGTALLNHADPDALLRSDNLELKISDALAQKLFDPTTWQEGSSFSHFDEASHPAGSPGALMSPSIASQEVERDLDAAVLGVMARIGWPMRLGAVSPTIGSVVPAPNQATVNWSVDLGQAGPAPDSFRVEARIGSTVMGSTTVTGAAATATVTGLQNGTTYTMAVVPVADGVDGTPGTAAVALPALATPRAVTTTGSGLNPTVTWLPPEGATATSFDVERSTDGGPWVAIGSTSGMSLPTTVVEGVHQFRVRGINSEGTSAWAYSIPVGISDGVVRPVPLDGEISRLYQAYFLRQPDPAGFAFWRDQRAAGAGLGAIADAFAASSEFQAAYGSLTDEQFVDLVYENVLDRDPDSSGLAHWLSVLAAGVSRGDVMVGFSESTEFIANTGTKAPLQLHESEVYRLYVAFFLRVPDESGLDYWLGVRAGGASLADIAAAFTASTEFQANYGLLPDQDFVELVYNNVLAREPDSVGLQHWLAVLAAGVDRGSMMTGFSQSQEFLLATGTVP